MNLQTVQKDILDHYFATLQREGYMNMRKVNQVVFSVLLLDAISMFNDYITGEFKHDVDVMMRKLDCCNCSISWNNANLSSPFYVMGQWNTGVAPHTHIINEIIGLQSRLDELTAKIKKVDAKANAGL